MSNLHLDLITAAFVILNVVLMFVALKLGRSQSTPSLDELMKAVADAAGSKKDED